MSKGLSFVGLMDLGTLDALKKVTVPKIKTSHPVPNPDDVFDVAKVKAKKNILLQQPNLSKI